MNELLDPMCTLEEFDDIEDIAGKVDTLGFATAQAAEALEIPLTSVKNLRVEDFHEGGSARLFVEEVEDAKMRIADHQQEKESKAKEVERARHHLRGTIASVVKYEKEYQGVTLTTLKVDWEDWYDTMRFDLTDAARQEVQSLIDDAIQVTVRDLEKSPGEDTTSPLNAAKESDQAVPETSGHALELERPPTQETTTDTSPEKRQQDAEPEPVTGEDATPAPRESQPLQMASDQPVKIDMVRNQPEPQRHETAKKKRDASPALAPQAKKKKKSKKADEKHADISQDEWQEPTKPDPKGNKGSLIVRSTTADERIHLDPNYLCGLFRLDDGRVYLFNAGVERPASEGKVTLATKKQFRSSLASAIELTRKNDPDGTWYGSEKAYIETFLKKAIPQTPWEDIEIADQWSELANAFRRLRLQRRQQVTQTPDVNWLNFSHDYYDPEALDSEGLRRADSSLVAFPDLPTATKLQDYEDANEGQGSVSEAKRQLLAIAEDTSILTGMTKAQAHRGRHPPLPADDPKRQQSFSQEELQTLVLKLRKDEKTAYARHLEAPAYFNERGQLLGKAELDFAKFIATERQDPTDDAWLAPGPNKTPFWRGLFRNPDVALARVVTPHLVNAKGDQRQRKAKVSQDIHGGSGKFETGDRVLSSAARNEVLMKAEMAVQMKRLEKEGTRTDISRQVLTDAKVNVAVDRASLDTQAQQMVRGLAKYRSELRKVKTDNQTLRGQIKELGAQTATAPLAQQESEDPGDAQRELQELRVTELQWKQRVVTAEESRRQDEADITTLLRTIDIYQQREAQYKMEVGNLRNSRTAQHSRQVQGQVLDSDVNKQLDMVRNSAGYSAMASHIFEQGVPLEEVLSHMQPGEAATTIRARRAVIQQEIQSRPALELPDLDLNMLIDPNLVDAPLLPDPNRSVSSLPEWDMADDTRLNEVTTVPQLTDSEFLVEPRLQEDVTSVDSSARQKVPLFGQEFSEASSARGPWSYGGSRLDEVSDDGNEE